MNAVLCFLRMMFYRDGRWRLGQGKVGDGLAVKGNQGSACSGASKNWARFSSGAPVRDGDSSRWFSFIPAHNDLRPLRIVAGIASPYGTCNRPPYLFRGGP